MQLGSRKNEIVAVFAVSIAEAMGRSDEELVQVRDAAREGRDLIGAPGEALVTARHFVAGKGEIGSPEAVAALRKVADLIQPLED